MTAAVAQARPATAHTRARRWRWARVLAGVALLAVVVWRLGTGPFVTGIRAVSGWSLAAAAGIGVVTTVCSAWRWRLVTRGLGIEVPLRDAVAAYYRSQFLNTVLPAGVLGDAHRGLRHGRDVGDRGLGLRAVAWERGAGQVVQAAVTIGVLLALPSPVRSSMPLVAGAVVLSVVVIALVGRTLPTEGASRLARILRTITTEVREGLLPRRTWPAIVLASIVVIAGHTTTFLIAVHTAGTTASVLRLLPLTLLVLLAMTVPTSIGGWGPREGAAAWAFGAAGLGADQGVAAAVGYGVMVLVACLPGAVVLLVEWLQRSRDRSSGGAL